MVERYVNESVFSQLFFEDGILNFWQIGGQPLLAVLWNLLLLAIPFLVVVLLYKYFQTFSVKGVWKWVALSLGGVIWLAFIPNSAYIITETRHLLDYCPIGSPRDICIIGAWMIVFYFIYSLIGWVSFVLLLRQMKNFLSWAFNQRSAQIFIIAVIPLIALGLMLGLVNRFNSWEIIVEPLKILDVMLIYFTDLMHFVSWSAFTIGLYLLYFFGDILFKTRFRSK